MSRIVPIFLFVGFAEKVQCASYPSPQSEDVLFVPRTAAGEGEYVQ
jgi:hypothetical protein